MRLAQRIITMMSGGGVAVPWYLSGSAPTPIAIYQPLGAASLAESYVNIINPGTYDCAPGVAPTLAAATGWQFDGATTWLNTAIVPDTNPRTWSMVVRFSEAVAVNRCVIGYKNTTGSDDWFAIYPNGGSSSVKYQLEFDPTLKAPNLAAGVLAICGTDGYRDGALDTAITSVDVDSTIPLIIGAVQRQSLSPVEFFDGKVQAVAIYNTTLTAPQILAVSTAMAALTEGDRP